MCKKHRDPVLFRGKEKPDPFNRAALVYSHHQQGIPYEGPRLTDDEWQALCEYTQEQMSKEENYK